jgi:DNA polymerase III alpha subunit
MDKILKIPENLDEFLENMKSQNYHRHSSHSNSTTPDSGSLNEEYAKRAKELGQRVLSSCEHGNQGNYWEINEICERYKSDKKDPYDLKFIFCAEAYWVKDRKIKDRTNSHIILMAKNETGRRAINRILSDANIDGYYHKPRIDIPLLLSLPPKDVFITSACIAFWHYEDIEEIIIKLHNHFKENFMLEVQYHNVKKQEDINKRILEVSTKYNIEIICGLDSHYIFPHEAEDREYILKSKGIKYEEEDGFFLDYPTVKETFERFKKQGVLSDIQILSAINNTNVCLEFEDIVLNKEVKIPIIFKDKTQKERNELYKDLVRNGWKKERDKIPKEMHEKYISEIKKEIDVVINTNMADYFIDDYYIVKRAIEKGGLLTDTGRGSGVSFYTNKLLGFTKVDRISAPVHMYPERFMSESRILESKSIPDLDLNWGNPEVAAEAQEEVIGKGNCYPMIAYGTLKAKSAWKMYSRANDVEFSLSNEVSNQIGRFEKDYQQSEEEDREDLDIYDYVDEQFHYLLDESKKYRGIISDKKKHPCGWLIYDGNIKEEIGLIKVKSESTKKEYLVAFIDGSMADEYKFVKNDLLKVDVVNGIKLSYKRANAKIPEILELDNILRESKEMQRIYAEGITMGINQFEKTGTTNKSIRFKPKNSTEATAFVAAIRPSFKSMYKIFENRESFNYGIEAFDKLIQTKDLPNSFILYQEQLMSALGYSGIPMDETMTIIKAISKKKTKIIMSYQKEFVNGFSEKIVSENKISKEDAIESAKKVWQIIEDSARYGFNASHAYCVANDSMYGAHLKAFYTYEFYETMLNMYSLKGKKDKVSDFRKEMHKFFNIKDGLLKFGIDNRTFNMDKERECIHPSLVSIKGFGVRVAEELYNVGKKEIRNGFYGVLEELKKTKVQNPQIEKLIKIGYFSEYGKAKKLLTFFYYFNLLYGKTQPRKKTIEDTILDKGVVSIIELNSRNTPATYSSLDSQNALLQIWNHIPDLDITLKDKILAEFDTLGYVNIKEASISPRYVLVNNLDTEYSPKMNIYCIKNGKELFVKISKRNFNKNIKDGTILFVKGMKDKYKKIPSGVEKNGKKEFIELLDEPKQWWITDYEVVEGEIDV